MELEADARPRLDIPHAGQKQSRQHFAVRQAFLDPAADFFEQPILRCFFEQAHERFDFGIESDDIGIEFGVVRRDGGKFAQQAKAAEGCGGQELPAIIGERH